MKKISICLILMLSLSSLVGFASYSMKEVEGILGYCEYNGKRYITIKDSTVTIKGERGREIVE